MACNASIKFQIDRVEAYQKDNVLSALIKTRGYRHQDEIVISKEQPEFEAMVDHKGKRKKTHVRRGGGGICMFLFINFILVMLFLKSCIF